jgi:hypothetical protein
LPAAEWGAADDAAAFGVVAANGDTDYSSLVDLRQ